MFCKFTASLRFLISNLISGQTRLVGFLSGQSSSLSHTRTLAQAMCEEGLSGVKSKSLRCMQFD